MAESEARTVSRDLRWSEMKSYKVSLKRCKSGPFNYYVTLSGEGVDQVCQSVTGEGSAECYVTLKIIYMYIIYIFRIAMFVYLCYVYSYIVQSSHVLLYTYVKTSTGGRAQ